MRWWLGGEICVFVGDGSSKFGQCCENEISIVKEFVRLNLKFLKIYKFDMHQSSLSSKIILHENLSLFKDILLKNDAPLI